MSFNPLTDEKFQKLEVSLQNLHNEDYTLYLSTPEVHPDYSSSRLLFENQYKERYGSQGSGEEREKLWEIFWSELINDQKEEEWQVKRENLVKKYEADFLKEHQCFCPDSDSSSDSDIFILSEKITPSKPNQSTSTASAPVTVSSTDSSPVTAQSASSIKDLASDFSLSESLHLLSEVCDSLGEFFGSLMRVVIGRVRQFSNTREAFLYLGEADTVKLLQMTAEKIREASVSAEGSYKSKLLYCDQTIQQLIDYASENIVKATKTLDINELAKATLHKEASVIVAMIKQTLKSYGIKDPSQETVYKVYSEIASLHLKAALNM